MQRSPTGPPDIYRLTSRGLAFGFGGWTLLCNLVVLARGSLRTLTAAALVVATGAMALWVWRSTTTTTPARTPEAPQPARTAGQSLARRRLPWGLVPGTVVTIAVWELGHSLNRPRLAWGIAVLYMGAALVWEMSRSPDTNVDHATDPAEPSPIVIAALLLVAVAATVTLQRPDVDDAFYVGLAVHAVDAPDRPLMSEDPIVGVPGTPLMRHHSLRSLELLTAVSSFLTGVPAIDFAHRVWPPVWAVVVVLAHATLFRLLVPERWLAATVTVVLIFLTVGDTHRWYSNFAFVRLHQGKGVFLSAVLPFLVAAAIECARRPTPGRWLTLVFLQIAAVGLAPTALWVAPCVVLPVFFVGATLSLQRRGLRSILDSALVAALACAYVLAVGLRLRAGVASWLASRLVGVSSLQLVRDAQEAVCGTGPLAFLVALSVALAWSTCASTVARRFCLVLPLAFLTVLANPYLARTIAGFGPGADTYLRTYWVLPAPVLLALCLTAPLGVWGSGGRPSTRAAAWLVLVLAFVWLVPRVRVMSHENDVSFAFLGLKVPTVEYAVAGMLVHGVAPGSRVVAPAEVAPWVVVYHRHPDPLVVREMYLSGGVDERNRRMEMTSFASAPDSSLARRDLFLAGLDAYSVSGVSFRGTAEAGPLRAGLAARGFRAVGRMGAYEVWSLTLPAEVAPAPMLPGRRRAG